MSDVGAGVRLSARQALPAVGNRSFGQDLAIGAGTPPKELQVVTQQDGGAMTPSLAALTQSPPPAGPVPPPPACEAPVLGLGGTFNPAAALAALRGRVEGLRDPNVLDMAVHAFAKAWKDGDARQPTLVVIDFSIPADKPRLWVIDLRSLRVLHHLRVAHGSGSGERGGPATHFANQEGTHASSVGTFITGGYSQKSSWPSGSMVLRGLERGFNDQAQARAIVMHGADYVRGGGRSHGCPALEPQVAVEVMKRIAGGSVLFAYGNEPQWLRTSRYVRCN